MPKAKKKAKDATPNPAHINSPRPWQVKIWRELDTRTMQPTGRKNVRIECRMFPDTDLTNSICEMTGAHKLADAHLMAIAPEMFDALMDVRQLLIYAISNKGNIAPALGECEALFKKIDETFDKSMEAFNRNLEAK